MCGAFRTLILTVVAVGTIRSGAAQTAPVNGGAARVVALAGRVSVLRDNNPWALGVGSIIQPQQTVVTGPDGLAKFEVADGSTFEVFPNSQVIFRNNRGNWQDLLEVFLGKVRVTIEHLGGQPNHNRVHTPTAVISVRGTVFDVDVEDSEATTLILVEEGVVEVRHLLKPGDAKLLNAGDWIRVFRNQPLAMKYVDRGAVFQRAMAATRDALYQVLIQNSSPGAGKGTGTVPVTAPPADGCKGNACSAQPATPPPPPPPPPAP